MADDITTLQCRRCKARKHRDDMRVDYGMASDGTAAGGLCNVCAEAIARVTVPEAVASYLAERTEEQGTD